MHFCFLDGISAALQEQVMWQLVRSCQHELLWLLHIARTGILRSDLYTFVTAIYSFTASHSFDSKNHSLQLISHQASHTCHLVKSAQVLSDYAVQDQVFMCQSILHRPRS